MPLTLLFPTQGTEAPGNGAKVDIIAVHGLNPRGKPAEAHAWDTWRTPPGPNGRLWLRDDLPQYVPESRIFLYEYNATAVYVKDQDTFVGRANELLEVIRIERNEVPSRPIIFLCHSMGGLLVKQALINAHNNPMYTPIKLATSGLAFFATPHNGGKATLVNLGRVAVKIARTLGFHKGDDVLETLEKGNMFSSIMHEHWRHQVQEYDVISFWGSQDTVVSRTSAQLELSGESGPIVKLNADHRGVCKFGLSSTDKANFKLVGENINIIYQKALKKAEIVSSHQLRGMNGDSLEAPMGRLLVNDPNIVGNSLGSITSDEPPPPARLCWYYIPLPKNRQFTGREAILDEIRSKLFVKNKGQRLAVVGLGGIGKTQVVLQLAYWVKETQRDYSIFWVPVMSYQTFEQAYTEIARRFDIPINKNDVDPKDSIRRYLESESSGKWLLIVDNADDKEVIFGKDGDRNSVYRYLPISDNGLILYTTRSREIAFSVASNQVVDLQQLTYDEAEALLERSMAPSIASKQEHKAELLEELCYIPLAITNAVAYLNANLLPIRKYLDLLRGTEEDIVNMMTQEFNDSSRYDGSQNAVATTWIVSFEKIAKSDPLAAQLLSFVSCIEPKAIPGSLLPSTEPKSNTERAIGILCQYSFLVRRGESDTFDMHALVHLASRIWTRKLGCLPEIMTRAVDYLNEVFPNDHPENRELWREYLPHVLRALERSKEYQIQERYDLLYQIGSCLSADRRFKEAIKALEESRELFYKQLGNNHGSASEGNQRVEEINQKPPSKEAPTGLEIEHELGYAYIHDRRIQEAIVILQHVVAVRKDTLAEEDNDRLTSEHELARAYLNNQQVQEAIVILEHIVSIEKYTLTKEDNNRLASEHVLARAYLDNQQVQKAIELLEHVVAVERGVNMSDEDRLVSKNLLTEAYEMLQDDISSV